MSSLAYDIKIFGRHCICMYTFVVHLPTTTKTNQLFLLLFHLSVSFFLDTDFDQWGSKFLLLFLDRKRQSKVSPSHPVRKKWTVSTGVNVVNKLRSFCANLCVLYTFFNYIHYLTLGCNDSVLGHHCFKFKRNYFFRLLWSFVNQSFYLIGQFIKLYPIKICYL